MYVRGETIKHLIFRFKMKSVRYPKKSQATIEPLIKSIVHDLINEAMLVARIDGNLVVTTRQRGVTRYEEEPK